MISRLHASLTEASKACQVFPYTPLYTPASGNFFAPKKSWAPWSYHENLEVTQTHPFPSCKRTDIQTYTRIELYDRKLIWLVEPLSHLQDCTDGNDGPGRDELVLEEKSGIKKTKLSVVDLQVVSSIFSTALLSIYNYLRVSQLVAYSTEKM